MEQVHGAWIKGPMKWIFIILGPNHHAKDVRSVLANEYNNLNIIVVLVTNAQAQKVGIQKHEGHDSKEGPVENGAGPGGNHLSQSAANRSNAEKSVHSGSQKQASNMNKSGGSAAVSGSKNSGNNKSGTQSGSRS